MAAPVLKELKCPNCSSPLQQHLASAQAIVCSACGSHVAIGTEEAQILSQGKKIFPPKKPIFPGDKATINGTEFFVMGRVEYRGWDDEDQWTWTEWLLGGADGQLVWLSYDQEEGFVLFRKLRVRTPFNPDEATAIPTSDPNRQAIVRERYPAKIVAAEGELTWQAKAGEQLRMIEGVSGDKHYSVQVNSAEIEIHEGVKIPEEKLAEAFQHEKWKHDIKQRGHQREALMMVGFVAVILALLALGGGFFTSISNGRSVSKQTVVVNSAATQVFPVTINGANRPAMVKVQMNNPLPVNTWAEVDVNIIQPNEDDLYEFSASFWHESGYDEGYWEEDDYNISTQFVPPQAGTYRFEVGLGEQTTAMQEVIVDIEVYENSFFPQWFWGYSCCFGILGLIVLFYVFQR